MEKAIILEHVALRPGGGVTVRLQKTLMDGNEVFSREPHMFTVSGDQDLEASLADLDAYLALNKWPKLSADDRKFILGQSGKASVVQARAAASDFAQAARAEAESKAAAAVDEIRAEAAKQIEAAAAEASEIKAQAETDAQAAIAAAKEEAAQLIDAADQRAQAAEGRAAALEAAQEADTRYAEPGS